MHALQDIPLRDPFVLPDAARGVYFMYGTTNNGTEGRFDCYQSRDLVTWAGPTTVFAASDQFWGTSDFWAPEVHRYGDHYAMFASFKAEHTHRATDVLVAATPLGPFRPHSPQPLTPPEWDCLDGTLWVEAGQPWLVFCHEWVQIQDGAIAALPLTADLTAACGAPQVLFHASAAPWVSPIGAGGMVTDGPFLYRLDNGALALLWSSFGAGGYTLGVAYAESGRLRGPWRQGDPLHQGDGGHGMLFRSFAGRLLLALHAPNSSPDERVLLLPITALADRLAMPARA